MGSLKEIKGRIASIQSTQKITSAMRMVASAKLHRTQGMTENFLRYKDSLEGIVRSLERPLLTPRGEDADNRQRLEIGDEGLEIDSQDDLAVDNFIPKTILLIPVSSNSGLCGAFNSNIAKATLKRIAELEKEGSKVVLMPVGKKIAHDLKREGKEFDSTYSNLMEKVEKGEGVGGSAALMKYVVKQYKDKQIQRAEFIYHHFKSMGSQVITVKDIKLDKPKTGAKQQDAYITEPSAEELMESLFPLLMNADAYGTMLDSLTSEHASRMMAMQTADDNANELLRELTLLYNKTRQQAITNELIDIMGGKVGG